MFLCSSPLMGLIMFPVEPECARPEQNMWAKPERVLDVVQSCASTHALHPAGSKRCCCRLISAASPTQKSLWKGPVLPNPAVRQIHPDVRCHLETWDVKEEPAVFLPSSPQKHLSHFSLYSFPSLILAGLTFLSQIKSDFLIPLVL